MKIKGYKKAMLIKYLHITEIMDAKDFLEADEYILGRTLHYQRANIKKGVKEKLEVIENNNK